MKLCKDCRHYRLTLWQRISQDYPRCARTRKESVDCVSGKVTVYTRPCCFERRPFPDPDPNACGPDAKHFEAKNSGWSIPLIVPPADCGKVIEWTAPPLGHIKADFKNEIVGPMLWHSSKRETVKPKRKSRRKKK